MIYIILSLIIGVSIASLVWIVFVIEKDLSPSILYRLDRIKRKSNLTYEQEKSEKLDLDKQTANFSSPIMEKYLKNTRIAVKIKEMINLSGLKWHIDDAILYCFAAGAPFILLIFTEYAMSAILCLVMFFMPLIYLNYLANKRFLDFSKQFPDALNLMASSLRAGHPLFAALNFVTDEMPSPICEVFETTKRDISLGVDSKDAFLSMTKVMPKSIDLRFFITAVLIQKEVGGNLAELLDSLSDTIRERFKLLGQLRVQTAQTKISGMVLGCVPVGVLLLVYFMNPDYMKPMFETPDGQIALAIAFVLIVSGFIAMRKISNIEI